MRWRSLALAVALSLAVGGCQLLPLGGSNAAQGAQGRIVWPKDGDLWVLDLASHQQTKITNLPSGAAVTGASWSPNGQQVVYAQFYRRPNERSTGADLFIANADGSDAHVFVSRDAPNTVLETPQWMASGRIYYTMRQVNQGHETLSIWRQAADGGEPEKLVDNGYNPAVSPDESTLLYMRPTQNGQDLRKLTIGQPGDGCELISDQMFQYLSLPRISPDGTRLALGGSGEPNFTGPSGCGGDPQAHPSAAGGALLAMIFDVGVAEAHGLPADVWSMKLDGSDMQRIADIKDDDPTVAWSPEGAKLAIFGVAALYVVDSSGGPPAKLVQTGGYGGLDWTR